MRLDTGVRQPLVSYEEYVSPSYLLYHVSGACLLRFDAVPGQFRLLRHAGSGRRLLIALEAGFFRLETQDSEAACIEL